MSFLLLLYWGTQGGGVIPPVIDVFDPTAEITFVISGQERIFTRTGGLVFDVTR